MEADIPSFLREYLFRELFSGSVWSHMNLQECRLDPVDTSVFGFGRGLESRNAPDPFPYVAAPNWLREVQSLIDPTTCPNLFMS